MFHSINKRDVYVLGSTIFVWILLLFVIDVKGNFPTNDDWSYSYSVKTFLETGKLELTGWVSMPIVSQVMWGYLFTFLFGFSFEILRISTIILSMLGLSAFYFLLKEVASSLYLKIIILLLVAFNPIYFLLSSSFMTDVPFFTFSIISVLYLFKFLKSKRFLYLLSGIIFIAAASFIRQIGVLTLLAFAVSYSLYNQNSFARKIYLFLFIFFLVILIAVFPSFVQTATNEPLINNTRMVKFFDAFSLKNLLGLIPLIKNGFTALIYIGLFSFPFWINIFTIISKKMPIRRVKYVSLIFVLSSGITGLLIIFNKILPLRPNVLWDYGLGPATLRDVDILLLDHINKIPSVIWILLTFIGVLGFLLIVSALIITIKNYNFRNLTKTDNSLLFIFLTAALYLIFISLADFYDRYLIFLLPLILFLLLNFLNPAELSIKYPQRSVAVFSLLIMILFTAYETQNYFSWNRCRWNAVNYLITDLKIPTNKIDGGFEFNGWYEYDPGYKPEEGKSWWWVKDDQYIITFGKLDNFSVIKKLSYHTFTKKKYLYILKRR
jgi:hypothetical protein